ncbi:WSCD family member GA21586-like [Mya arenaria]|nr:WSCD family member GA21586-like [Mya arenaria]
MAQNITKAEYNSTQCKHRQVKLSERRLPLTGLLSFPGSGNTWTRHLIQQMTGIGTSSVYCDSGLRSKGFPFECNRELGKTIVVKAHDTKDLVRFQKIILLVRNPYDALLSYATYSKGGHTKIPNTNTIVQASNNMINDSLRWFISLPSKTCSTFRGPIYILQYDLLKADLQTELEKLAQFLDISVPQADIECTVRLQEGNFHRKSNAEDHLRMLRTVYDDKKLEQLRTIARKTESILEKHFKRNFYLGGDTEYALFGK